MKKLLKKIIQHCIDDLSNYTEDQLWEQKIIKEGKTFITKNEICNVLNISRYELSEKIRNNNFPKGRKRKGKKGLFWVKEELIKMDSRIERCKEIFEDRIRKEFINYINDNS